MEIVVRIINLVLRKNPAVYPEPLILGHTVVNTCYPVYGEQQVHDQTKSSHDTRTVCSAAKTFEKPEKLNII